MSVTIKVQQEIKIGNKIRVTTRGFDRLNSAFQYGAEHIISDIKQCSGEYSPRYFFPNQGMYLFPDEFEVIDWNINEIVSTGKKFMDDYKTIYQRNKELWKLLK